MTKESRDQWGRRVLRPCPFCGGIESQPNGKVFVNIKHQFGCWILKRHEYYGGMTRVDEDDVAWNERATDSKPADVPDLFLSASLFDRSVINAAILTDKEMDDFKLNAQPFEYSEPRGVIKGFTDCRGRVLIESVLMRNPDEDRD